LERESYSGGRTEAFFIGEYVGHVGHFDVNSLYPSVMRGNLFPGAFYFEEPKGKWTMSKYKQTKEYGRDIIAQVIVETDEPVYPYHGNERLVFPVGRFPTVLCGPELDYAMAHGHIQEWGKVQVYHMAELFTAYIDEFYHLRLRYLAEGDDFRAMMCKVGLLNSLYGKFGQRTSDWEETKAKYGEGFNDGIFYIADAETGKKIRYRKVGDRVESRSKVRDESWGANCAIASYVTSYARMKLWNGVLAAGGLQEVFYIDTDSLFLTKQGEDNLSNSGLCDGGETKELGLWHPEESQDGITIWGAKDYVFGEERKIKGIRKKAVEIAYDIETKTPNVFEQLQFVSLKGALNGGHPNEMRIKTIRKELSRVYTKGKVTSTGRIEPLVLPRDKGLV